MLVDEKKLLLSLKQGDKDAFDAIFKKYASRLYFFSLTFFNSRADADEIVQETFVKLWETRYRIDETQSFNTYLITIAKHIIYNQFRHKLVEQKYNEYILQTTGDSYSIENDLVLKNLKEHMLAGIAQLPPQQREILLLKRKGYDNEEIAGQLNVSKRTVETHINKAFKFLRTYLLERKEIIIALVISRLI